MADGAEPPRRRSAHQGDWPRDPQRRRAHRALPASTLLAGLGMLTGGLDGLYRLPAGVITAFAGTLLNTRVLPVENLR